MRKVALVVMLLLFGSVSFGQLTASIEAIKPCKYNSGNFLATINITSKISKTILIDAWAVSTLWSRFDFDSTFVSADDTLSHRAEIIIKNFNVELPRQNAFVDAFGTYNEEVMQYYDNHRSCNEKIPSRIIKTKKYFILQPQSTIKINTVLFTDMITTFYPDPLNYKESFRQMNLNKKNMLFSLEFRIKYTAENEFTEFKYWLSCPSSELLKNIIFDQLNKN